MFSFTNQSKWDRILRVVLGVVLLGLGWGGYVSGVLGIVLMVVGIIFLLTGLTGFCPLYTLLKLRTNQK